MLGKSRALSLPIEDFDFPFSVSVWYYVFWKLDWVAVNGEIGSIAVPFAGNVAGEFRPASGGRGGGCGVLLENWVVDGGAGSGGGCRHGGSTGMDSRKIELKVELGDRN